MKQTTFECPWPDFYSGGLTGVGPVRLTVDHPLYVFSFVTLGDPKQGYKTRDEYISRPIIISFTTLIDIMAWRPDACLLVWRRLLRPMAA